MVGDFNFHFNVEDDPDVLKLKDILNTSNLSQFVSQPTHINGHCLDLIISRSNDNIIDSVDVPFMFTDHAAIHCTLRLAKPKPTKKVINYRKWSSIYKNAMSHDIRLSDLITAPETDLDKLVAQYDTTLTNILNKHAPLKQRSVTILASNPWYTPDNDSAKKLMKRYERRWRT